MKADDDFKVKFYTTIPRSAAAALPQSPPFVTEGQCRADDGVISSFGLKAARKGLRVPEAAPLVTLPAASVDSSPTHAASTWAKAERVPQRSHKINASIFGVQRRRRRGAAPAQGGGGEPGHAEGGGGFFPLLPRELGAVTPEPNRQVTGHLTHPSTFTLRLWLRRSDTLRQPAGDPR